MGVGSGVNNAPDTPSRPVYLPGYLTNMAMGRVSRETSPSLATRPRMAY